MKHYQKIRKLGEGGMGNVWLVKDMQTQAICAMKESLCTSLLDEAKLLSQLRHPGIPQLIQHFNDCQNTYLVMDFIDGVTLAQYIQEHGAVKEKEVINWTIQLLDILCYLHKKKIIYCDLKLENIMLSKKGKISLIDYGVAVQKDKQNHIHYGTIGFAAPEQYDNNLLDERVDIYGVAKVMLALLSGIHCGDEIDCVEVSSIKMSKNIRNMITMCLYEVKEERYENVQELLYQLVNCSMKRKFQQLFASLGYADD